MASVVDINCRYVCISRTIHDFTIKLTKKTNNYSSRIVRVCHLGSDLITTCRYVCIEILMSDKQTSPILLQPPTWSLQAAWTEQRAGWEVLQLKLVAKLGGCVWWMIVESEACRMCIRSAARVDCLS